MTLCLLPNPDYPRMAYESIFFDQDSPVLIGVVALCYLILLAVGTLTALVMVRSAVGTHIDWRSQGRTLQERPISWADASIILGLLMILILATASVGALLKTQSPFSLLLIQSIGVDVAGIAVLAWYVRARKLGWNRLFSLQWIQLPSALRLGLYFYLSILPFVFFSSLISQGILSAHGYPPTLQDIAIFLSGNNPWWVRLYMLFMAIVLAPIFEECIFRGILLPLMARRFGVGPGIFLSSLIFAAIHFHMPSLVPLCTVAIGFSLGYLYSGSLWVPVTMHALFNGINLGLLLLIRP